MRLRRDIADLRAARAARRSTGAAGMPPVGCWGCHPARGGVVRRDVLVRQCGHGRRRGLEAIGAPLRCDAHGQRARRLPRRHGVSGGADRLADPSRAARGVRFCAAAVPRRARAGAGGAPRRSLRSAHALEALDGEDVLRDARRAQVPRRQRRANNLRCMRLERRPRLGQQLLGALRVEAAQPRRAHRTLLRVRQRVRLTTPGPLPLLVREDGLRPRRGLHPGSRSPCWQRCSLCTTRR